MLKEDLEDAKCHACGKKSLSQFTVFDLSSCNYFILNMGLGYFDINKGPRGEYVRAILDIKDFNEDDTILDGTLYIHIKWLTHF